MSDVELRPVRPGEHRVAGDMFRSTLLHAPYADEEWQKNEASWLDADGWAAWDGDTCVGHVANYRFDTVVPGGARLATAGVTRVGVLSTHTRRGVFSELMATLLRSARSDGRTLASLRATEAVIYGRFGFGVASECDVVEVDVRQARPLRSSTDGSVRILPRERWLEVLPDLYDRLADTRVGAISRPTWMWERYLADGLDGSAAQLVVVHTSASGVDDGYAHASLERVEELTDFYGRADVWDLWGATPEVELALWSHLLGIDLLRTVRVEECPRDLSLRAAAADPRACAVRLRYDETWLRVLDVHTALTARTYAAGPPVTVAVTDPLFPDNCGRWTVGGGDGAARLDGDPTGPADLVTDIAGLSATYLGSTSWWEQVAAGRSRATTDGAAARADAVFGHRPLAFSGSHF